MRLARGPKDPSRPPYLSHFALREAPFASGDDSRFFYADPARQQCINMLQHLAEYSEDWLLVTGDPGVGKSAVLAAFLGHADAHLTPCRIQGSEQLDGGRLFLSVGQCFGLDLAGPSATNPLQALQQQLNALRGERVPVLAVDDADRLGDDALEIVLRLADLTGDHGKLLRVVVFGTAALQQRLTGERFAGLSHPHVLQLRAFDEGHTALYLAHRLSLAGFNGPNPFDVKTVRRLHKDAGGLPAHINQLADEVLREKMAAEKSTGMGTWPRRVLMSLVALGAAGALGFVLQENMEGFFGAPLSADESLVGEPVPGRGLPFTPTETVVPTKPPASATEPLPHAARPLVLREGESLQVTCSPLSSESGGLQSGEASAAASAPAEDASAPATASPAPAPAPVATTLVVEEPAPAPETAPATNTAPATSAAAAAPSISPASPAAPAMAAAPAPANPNPNPAKKTPTQPTHAAATAIEPPRPGHGPRWLAAQKPEHFTLQLLAAGQAETVRSVIKSLRLTRNYAELESARDGRPLYLLVSGSYPTREAALAAAQKLPRGTQAWPRRFADLAPAAEHPAPVGATAP